MATGMKCYNCGKGIMVGHNVSHAKNRTRKVFKPNLHRTRIIVDGRSMRVRLCTKCLRLVKGKDTRAKKAQAKKIENQSLIVEKKEEKSKISTSAPTASGLV